MRSQLIRFRHILCPIDFSEFSRHALDLASAIARRDEAQLTILHVVPNLPAMDLPPVKLQPKDRETLVGELKGFTLNVPPELKIDLCLQEAPDVHTEILEKAAAIHADLLVVGSHGRSGFQRFLLGSVTEKLMHKAPCPTMIVPRRAPAGRPDVSVQLQKILCPVDFSDASSRAVKFAIGMADRSAAEGLILHVIEVPPELQEFPLTAGFDVDKVRRAAEADCLRRLRDLALAYPRSNGSCETLVRQGAAYREIVKVATERECDLIVMGVRGRGAIDLTVFGSNTARVARAASCPVLVVPAVQLGTKGIDMVSPPSSWLVAIAASAGGIQAIGQILEALPRDLPAAIVIVQHRSPTIESSLERLLARRTHMPVVTATEGDTIAPGVVYLARPNLHLTVRPDKRFAYTDGTRIRFVLSSANPLLESAAAAYDRHLLAVVLTGYGADGTDGVQTVKAHGGLVIAQDQASSEQWGMPEAAVKSGAVDYVLPLGAIAPAIDAIVHAQPVATKT